MQNKPQQQARLFMHITKKKDIKPDGVMSFTLTDNTGNATYKVGFDRISDVCEVETWTSNKKMCHFGIMVENNFNIVKIKTSNKYNYKYSLIHALQHPKNKQVFFEFLYTNNKPDIKERLCKPLVNDHNRKEIHNNYKMGKMEKASRYATMDRVVEPFHILLTKQFDLKCAKDMALQNYDLKVNCVLAEKYIYAVITNRNQNNFVEGWMQHNRGYLLKQAIHKETKKIIKQNKNNNNNNNNDNIGAIEAKIKDEIKENGIPCEGGSLLWNTIGNTYKNKSNDNEYKMQEYKGHDESIKLLEERRLKNQYSSPYDGYNENAIVHSKKYRIIKTPINKNKSNNFKSKYISLDIFHTDDKKELQEKWNKIIKQD